jgi:hypothetical protein
MAMVGDQENTNYSLLDERFDYAPFFIAIGHCPPSRRGWCLWDGALS